jgi:serine/threonine-protein kinase
MTPHALPPGTLLGAFEVVSTLGRGGMGAVYAARNRITGDMRAVKVILPELAARPEFVGRFTREIRMAMAVEHPHLVRVFEPGMHGELIFLPMELLQGESLAAFLRRHPSVSVEAADNLIQSIGSAIVALHAKGILHRDVKPSNIFLAQDRGIAIPKLLDLGAGKEAEGNDENTSTGLAVGSPHYMAPEQAAGRKDLDARVDQYALATLAYQLLTGARPYENDDTGHVLAKVLSGAPFKAPREILRTLPPQLDAVVLRGMARTREERYPTLQEFLGAFHGAASIARGGFAPLPSPTRNAPTVRMSTAADPSGTVQTGVVATPARSSVMNAGLGIAAGVLTVIAGLFVVRVVMSHATATAPPPLPAPTALAAAPPPPVPTPVPVPTPLPAPAPTTLPPATSAQALPSAVAAAPSASTAPVTDEIDPIPIPAPKPPPPPAAPTPAPTSVAPPTPAATVVPFHTSPVANTPSEPAATPPPPSTPTPPPAPRPKPKAPAAAEPCRPTPGSPCL